MIIDFGQYKGIDLEDIPTDYLRWVVKQAMDENLLEAAEGELEYRDNYNLHF